MPVVSVTESQVVDPAGTLSDVYDIVFTIAGKPGSFTVRVPKDGDAVGAAASAIGEVAGEVNAIYSL